MGLDDDFSLRRLGRYLALASTSDLSPVIVLTGRHGDAAVDRAAFDGMRGRIAASLPLVMVDAPPDAALLLEPHLGAGQTAVGARVIRRRSVDADQHADRRRW